MNIAMARDNERFYDRTALWWGASRISNRDRERAAIIDAAENGPRRVLELGAGCCGTAAAVADLGHTTVAVERSPFRAALGRRHQGTQRSGDLIVLEADFQVVRIEDRFDVIAYWSGFGVGTDVDQRRLLDRVRGWIKPGGRIFIDIFDPLWWANAHGTVRSDGPLQQWLGFDPVTSRLNVTYWMEGRRGSRVTETIRCYTPTELSEMIQEAGLVLRGTPIRSAVGLSYLVQLTTR